MPQYEVDVRILDVNEPDALAARLAVENKLRAAGLDKWRVVAIHQSAAPGPFDLPRSPADLRARRSPTAYTGSVLLVAAIVAWVLWFLWVLSG